jgi:hypothetical protein
MVINYYHASKAGLHAVGTLPAAQADLKRRRITVQRDYIGYRGVGGAKVYVTTNGGETLQQLAPRNDLRNHCPDGFQWGYGGPGPAQLALAILADLLGDDELALQSYQRVMGTLIAPIQSDSFHLTEGQVWAHFHTVIV